MLEASQWAGPPPLAAQPVGIQSTAGAVPVMNEKGMLRGWLAKLAMSVRFFIREIFTTVS